MLEHDLGQAEQHVSEGEQDIVRQRELIAELQRDGHDATQTEALLAQFEETQALHTQHRDRLRRELGVL